MKPNTENTCFLGSVSSRRHILNTEFTEFDKWLRHHFIPRRMSEKPLAANSRQIWQYSRFYHQWSDLFLGLSATCVFYSSEIDNCIQYMYWSQSLLRHDSVAIVWLLRYTSHRSLAKLALVIHIHIKPFKVQIQDLILNRELLMLGVPPNTILPRSCMIFHYAGQSWGKRPGANWCILSLQPEIWGSCAKVGEVKCWHCFSYHCFKMHFYLL